jgi:UDPglucose--hexose-1-phosphate uridylyltransferase
MMGASNPHPHCQIWASSSVPGDALREVTSQRDYQRHKDSCLLCDYLAVERSRERLVCENDYFAALVPFWAVWPYETIVIPRRHAGGLDELSALERTALAGILRELTSRYDNLFGIPFPYSMGFHQRPTGEGTYSAYHLHAHFFPPLLRSATVKKFMVGYEMLAESQRDFTPEMAAERLRSISSKQE